MPTIFAFPDEKHSGENPPFEKEKDFEVRMMKIMMKIVFLILLVDAEKGCLQ